MRICIERYQSYRVGTPVQTLRDGEYDLLIREFWERRSRPFQRSFYDAPFCDLFVADPEVAGRLTKSVAFTTGDKLKWVAPWEDVARFMVYGMTASAFLSWINDALGGIAVQEVTSQ